MFHNLLDSRYSIRLIHSIEWYNLFSSIIRNQRIYFLLHFLETKLNTDLSDLTSTTTDDELKRIKTNNELAGDDMEDILTCVCCQDIMTNPICLEPCLHAFCSDCYASWEAVQRTWYVLSTPKKKDIKI